MAVKVQAAPEGRSLGRPPVRVSGQRKFKGRLLSYAGMLTTGSSLAAGSSNAQLQLCGSTVSTSSFGKQEWQETRAAEVPTCRRVCSAVVEKYRSVPVRVHGVPTRKVPTVRYRVPVPVYLPRILRLAVLSKRILRVPVPYRNANRRSRPVRGGRSRGGREGRLNKTPTLYLACRHRREGSELVAAMRFSSLCIG